MQDIVQTTRGRRIVDLHCHSSASGGAIGTPPRIARFFKDAGYAAFSLTEHDTFDSLEAATAESKRVARKACKGCKVADVGFECIPGVELSARVDDPLLPEGAAHILGYLYRLPLAPDCELRRIAEEALGRQDLWVRGALRKLGEKGIAEVGEDELRAHIAKRFGPDDVWKRPFSIGPIGDILRQRGVLPEGSGNNGVRRLFDEVYPRAKLPALPEVGRASEALGAAGAVRILAHPGGPRTPPSEAERERLERWLDRYVDGLEVFTPKHSRVYRDFEMELLRSRGRPFTGGTDRHSYEARGPASDAAYDCVDSLKEFRAS